jgi:hypothetical protein
MPVLVPAAGAGAGAALSQESLAAFRLSFRCATGALLFDLIVLLFLGNVSLSALFMAARGRVAINPHDATYDVGACRNLQHIFGAPAGWKWAVPIAPDVLPTNGLSFPRGKRGDDEARPLMVSQPEGDI